MNYKVFFYVEPRCNGEINFYNRSVEMAGEFGKSHKSECVKLVSESGQPFQLPNIVDSLLLLSKLCYLAIYYSLSLSDACIIVLLIAVF